MDFIYFESFSGLCKQVDVGAQGDRISGFYQPTNISIYQSINQFINSSIYQFINLEIDHMDQAEEEEVKGGRMIENNT